MRIILAMVLWFALGMGMGQAAFNPESEAPGQFNSVMDAKEKQLKEAEYRRLKMQMEQAETVRKAEAESRAKELASSFIANPKKNLRVLDHWFRNASLIGLFALVVWLIWKYTFVE